MHTTPLNDLIEMYRVETPTTTFLRKNGYYERFRQVYVASNKGDGLEHIYGAWEGGTITMPVGITGQELVSLRQQFNDEYKKIEGKHCGIEECKKRGAMEGHGDLIKPS